MTLALPFDLFIAPVALLAILPVAGLHRHPQPAEESREPHGEHVPAPSPWVNSRTRRILECVVAALALILLLPVIVACWLAVRLTSPGPGFFRQMRAGRNAESFALYKFRSMRISASKGSLGHTVHNDHRITAVGCFLRRFKLDELPQFWNVLKGDMSLVGPRPKLPHHEGLCMPYRPGLTGRATLAFRHEERMLLLVHPTQVESFYQAVVKPIKARLDVEYMREATFASDVRLLYHTMKKCFAGPGNAERELMDLISRFAPEKRGYAASGMNRQGVEPGLDRPCAGYSDRFADDLDDAA